MYKFLICLFLLSANLISAQEAYFQQEVNYKIDVTLNDTTHTLDGQIEMEYINHSPDELDEIYIHLWANAFKNRSTAFAKQKINQGSSKFFFAKDKQLGRYRALDFKINGVTTNWSYHPKHPDIAILSLPVPLKSGERLTITTPLNLKIPASFSRLGHVGQSYQMTQWYPKPAVYDKDGWHPMPYVDMGEFYSEFGHFDVKITLPKNYVVGATGELQNESEKQFLQQRVAETKRLLAELDDDALKAMKDTFPPSSPTVKTLHYTAENVHDFAWFADKRFYVQNSEVILPSGKKVDTWAMFNNAEAWLWRKGIFYVDRSVEFYSKHVGEYPYPQATALQSALSAGGGMEYPMITVIGLMGNAQSLDEVITHEVGHNWFYGILAFDEREHPWLDEGINSYYDHRYTEQYYRGSNAQFLPDFVMKGSDMTLLELAYLYQARRNLDQAPETHSEEFGLINYFLGGYEKPAVCFKWLEKYLGTPQFDAIMQAFYQEWKFKHPQPEDFRLFVEARTDKNIDWFFDGLIGSNDKTDYAFAKLKENENNLQLSVKNKGQLNTPFPVSALKNGEVVHTQWYDGFPGKKQLDFPKGDYDELVIDREKLTLDVFRKNNKIRTSGLFKKMPPLSLKFLTGIENPDRTRLFWVPLSAYNVYDEFMLGLGLYNITLPEKPFEFSFAPLYSFSRKEINGIGNVKYHLYPEADALRRITLDLGVKKFNNNYVGRGNYYTHYWRLVPSLNIELGTKHNKAFTHEVNARFLYIEEEFGEFLRVDTILFNEETMMNDTLNFTIFSGKKPLEKSRIYEVSYAGSNKKAVNPFNYKIALEYQQYTDAFSRDQSYWKASLEWNTAYTYASKKNIDFRFFVGSFLKNTRRSSGSVSERSSRGSFALTHQGYNDYKYDEFHFGRNEINGIWSQQVNLQDGGMKNAFGSAFSDGQSNAFIFTINVKADLPKSLPFNIPLKPYFDLGYFNDNRPIASDANFNDQLWWSGGLMLDFQNVFSIHFPLVNSNNLKTLYDQRSGGDYGARITWKLDLNRANPFELIQNIGI